MPSSRSLGYSLLVGVCYAAGLVTIALELGYSIGPTAYSPVGLLWRYGGLVVAASIPVWFALRFRLLVPLVALALTTGYVVGMEVTPPGPTFRDVSELERLGDPTGILVVENGLYIVRYMVNASVWSLGFLLTGVVEASSRNSWHRLPAVPGLRRWTSASRRRATTVAVAGGLLHAAVMVWFAQRLGLTATGGHEWVLYAVGTFGMWLLAAVPFYLLVRHTLVAPITLLTAFVFLDASATLTVSVEDPHALYFGAWFLYLALLLVVAGLEYALRRLDIPGTTLFAE